MARALAAAYIRVSSKSQTLEMQRAAIARAAAARGDTIGTWYAEKQSAATLARVALSRLRADARAGAIRRLYVFRLDRLARSGIRDTFEVVEQLHAAGVELVTIADGFDLAGPAAEVVLAVMAWAAKMERLAINERIAAARLRLQIEGRRWGRPSRLCDDQREQMSRRSAAGESIRSIAIAMKVPRSTVARALAVSALSRNVPPARHPRNGQDRATKQGPARK